MVSRSVFKILVLLLLLWGCKDLPRDNLFDPQNPNSYTVSRVLVEAFVNVAHPSPYNGWALQSLHQLQDKYRSSFILCEYHRDIQADTATYDDPYNTEDNQTLFQLLQDRYVNVQQNIPRVVPDVYLNGAQERFSGAYDAQSLKEQIEPVFLQLRTENYFKLEPVIEGVDDSTISLKCRIAGLGRHAVQNKRLRIIFIKRQWDQKLKLNLNVVVKLVWPGISVPEIKKGKYKTLKAGTFRFQVMPDAVVLALVSEDELTVYQAIYTDLMP